MWKTFHAARSGYSVKFPGDPVESSANRQVAGPAVTTHKAEFMDHDRDMYFVASYREPVAGLIVPQDSVVAGLSQKYGKPTSERRIDVSGHAGREAVFNMKNYTIVARYFPNEVPFCWLLVVTPDRYAQDPDVTTFTSSMQFDSPPH
jgi:hypothetical protein